MSSNYLTLAYVVILLSLIIYSENNFVMGLEVRIPLPPNPLISCSGVMFGKESFLSLAHLECQFDQMRPIS